MRTRTIIHSDTNFLIQATVAGSPAHADVRRWTAAQESFGISTVAWAEFMCGPLDPIGERIARQIVPRPDVLNQADAEHAARLFNLTGRRSRSLADCMIAAVAMRCVARLATINRADSQPMIAHGLVLA